MLLALSVVCLFGAVFLATEVVSVGARQRALALRRASTYARPRIRTGPERLKFRERVIFPAANRLSRLAMRVNPRVTVESIQLKLMTAGLSQKISPTTFLALKAALAIGLGVFGLLLGSAVSFVGTLFFAVGFGFAGFAFPGIYVSMKARGRREKIRAELPDALDLLAVSVEAGLGFDGAVDKLTDNLEGSLADEFALTLGEMRIGESRHDALKKLAVRVDTPEVAAFSRAIIQADQLGISLGRILKVQAADSRNRRQMAAEEKAMKAPIKMMFPTVLFIFPAMFLVVLGPAVLSLKEIL
jgi:tight adherence protein C